MILNDIHMAAADGNLAELQRQLLNGIDVNLQNSDEVTPLMCAAACGELDAIKLLLEHGADPSLVDPFGMTAADLADEKGETAACQFLKDQVTR